MRKIIATAALVIAAGLGAGACGSHTASPASAAKPAVTSSQPASVPGPSLTLKEAALALAAKAGCPDPADIATDGAPGAFPGAPYVGFTCDAGGTSAYVSVFGSHADQQANLAYRTANTGGTLVVGYNFIANIYNDDAAHWARLLGGTVH